MPAPARTYRRRGDSDSGAFFKVATLLLGLAVGALAMFALASWASSQQAQDDAEAALAQVSGQEGGDAPAVPVADDAQVADHNTALPLDSFAGVVPDDAAELAQAHEPKEAVLPPVPEGNLVKVEMTLKDVVVEVAPGVEYTTWSFDGHGAPGPIVHVREGQTVEMTLVNGGTIPHSIDFHAARIAPNVAFKDVPVGESFTFRFKADDPGVYMYHCGTKPVLAHIANGMYGAIVVDPAEPLPAGRQLLRPCRQRVVPERRRDRRAGQPEHGQGAGDAAGLDDLQRLRQPVRRPSPHGGSGRDDPLLRRRRRADARHQLPRRRGDPRSRLGER